MRALSEWLRARFSRRAAREVSTVTVVLTLDMTSFAEGMARVTAAVRTIRRDVDRVTRVLRHRQQLAQAGAEARWYVRGGMDPTYADPADRDAEVRRLARTYAPGVDVNRLAAAFLRGWVEHRQAVAR